jgi:uncharacterized protein YndB with AHSA1/START domain/DNA-binding transcriptional ArsR family regulator
VDDAVFRALADPSRRTLLDRLFERDGQTLGELEAALPGMTRFGVMKHLRVLEAAGLVTSRKVGRERHHYLNPVPIRRIHDRWLDRFRARAADVLEDLRVQLEAPKMSPRTTLTGTPPAHVFATHVRATPEAIWRAITESEFTLRYYYASTVESDWRPGSPYVYRIDGHPQIEGEVLEADPPRRLVMTFHATWDEKVAADAPSRHTWEIEEMAPGVCRVTVTHDQLEGRDATAESVLAADGWPFILSGLKTLLETGEPLMGAADAEHTHH